MAELLILQFDGVSASDYAAVNSELGIDMHSGTGDWPAGLVTHAAGMSEDGALVVIEVWNSRTDQDAFMSSRLGPALAASGVTSHPSVTWAPAMAHHNPGL
jgi:hypothetical protein